MERKGGLEVMQKSQQMSRLEKRQFLLKIAEENSWPDSVIKTITENPSENIEEACDAILEHYDGSPVPFQVFNYLITED